MHAADKLSLSYAGFYGSMFEDFVVRALELGFSSVQFIPDQTPNLVAEMDPERLVRLRDALTTARLNCSVHAVFYDINLVSVVPEVQDAALDILRQNLEFAVAIGASRVTAHPGYMFPGWRSSEFQAATFWSSAGKGLAKLDVLARQYAIRVYLENGSYYVSSVRSQDRTPLHIGITVAEMTRLLAGTSLSLGLCLDVGKAQASGSDFRTFLSSFRDRVGQIQISTWAAYEELVASAEFAALPAAPEIVFEGGAARAEEFVRNLKASR